MITEQIACTPRSKMRNSFQRIKINYWLKKIAKKAGHFFRALSDASLIIRKSCKKKGFDERSIQCQPYVWKKFDVKNNDKCCRCCSRQARKEMYAQNISNKRNEEENVCRLDWAKCGGGGGMRWGARGWKESSDWLENAKCEKKIMFMYVPGWWLWGGSSRRVRGWCETL